MTTQSLNGSLNLRPAALAAALALSAPVAAEPIFQVPLNANADMRRYSENNVEIGGGANSEDSFKFGEFSGLRKDEPFLILNVNWLQRDSADDSRYWSVFGSNLGLPSRIFEGEIGQQGNYRLTARFDELTRYQFDSTSFIHQGLGSENLTLPPGFAQLAGQPPAAAAQLATFARPFDIKQERTGYEIGGSKLLGGNWDISTSYRLEEREGNKLIGAVVGNAGGNPRAVILPRPIDDKTHQFDVTANWTTARTQLQGQYYVSIYDPEVQRLTWQNPFTNAAWAAAANAPGAQGQLALDPDNQYHQFQVSGAHNLGTATRVTGLVSYGIMMQDEAFLPYTVNPGLLAPLPLPRGSLDGEIENTLVDLGISARPLKDLAVRASYRYDDRDNRTPQSQFSFIGGDSQNQFPNPGSDPTTVRTNLPVSSTQHTLRVRGDYAIAKGTRLTGEYQYQDTDRTFEARAETEEHRISAELRRIMSAWFTGGLRYTYSTRDGSTYDCSVPTLASFANPPSIAFPSTGQVFQCDTHPLLRKFHLADRDENRIKAFGSLSPTDTTSLQLAVDYYQADYNDTFLGLTDSTGVAATVDGSWAIREDLSAFAFYTYEKMAQDQTGQSFGGGNAADNFNRLWAVDLDDRTDTVGLGVNFKAIPEKLDVGAQYIFSRSEGRSSFSTGPALTSLPVPDIKTTLSSLQLFASYAHDKNTTFRLNYWYERYRSSDWAFDNATISSSNNVILTGQTSPDYDAHVIGFSVAVKSW
ncbi:MAG: MtrB/PioB family decaheme-associated outer membrane protein [Pseudomonadota bacterium]